MVEDCRGLPHYSLPHQVEKKAVGCLREPLKFLCLDPLMNGAVGRDYRATARGLGLAGLGCSMLFFYGTLNGTIMGEGGGDC